MEADYWKDRWLRGDTGWHRDAVMPLLNAGHDVLLVAHAHVLRILTSQWLDVDPHFARLLRLDTAHYCVLSQYKGDNVIEHWNC